MIRTIAALLIASAGLARPQTPDDLAAMYKYDRTVPLDIQIKEMAARNGYQLFSISFAYAQSAVDVNIGFAEIQSCDF